MLPDGPPGFLLPIFNPRADHKQGCCSASDAEDARRVADRLDIPFYALNLQAEFRQIIDYFVDEYTRGRTPNPCVLCNNWLKFGKLFDYADSVGAEFVATGHYAAAASPPARRRIGPAALLPRRRRRQGPVVRAVRHRAAAARADAAAGRRISQAADSRAGGEGRPARGRQEGQPGDLLRHQRQARRVRPPAAARRRYVGRDRHDRRPRRRHASGHRAVHDRPAEGAGRGDGRAVLRRPDRAGDAAAS